LKIKVDHMKRNQIIGVVAIVALVASLLAIWKTWRIDTDQPVTDPECKEEKIHCNDNCEKDRERTLAGIGINERFALLNHQQVLLGCNNEGNPLLRQQCINKENASFARTWNRFQAQKQNAETTYRNCINGCSDAAQDCQDNARPVPQNGTPFRIECIDDGAFVCFKPVDEFCKKINGVCDDCWRTLCPGQVFEFESKMPIDIELVAANDISDSVRVIAAAAAAGNRLQLNAPNDIMTNPGERLFIRFTSKERKSLLNATVMAYKK
jgi:hypothetical protein